MSDLVFSARSVTSALAQRVRQRVIEIIRKPSTRVLLRRSNEESGVSARGSLDPETDAADTRKKHSSELPNAGRHDDKTCMYVDGKQDQQASS